MFNQNKHHMLWFYTVHVCTEPIKPQLSDPFGYFTHTFIKLFLRFCLQGHGSEPGPKGNSSVQTVQEIFAFCLLVDQKESSDNENPRVEQLNTGLKIRLLMNSFNWSKQQSSTRTAEPQKIQLQTDSQWVHGQLGQLKSYGCHVTFHCQGHSGTGDLKRVTDLFWACRNYGGMSD